jgi:mono/diheme cytochrome c family protein
VKAKRFVFGAGALVVLGFAVFMGLTTPAAWEVTHPSRDLPDAGAPDLVNGKTMFVTGDCAVCHSSADQNDATRLGGGRSLSSAFGTFYMPNISSDAEDGIGNWTTPQLIRAMREGVSPHGESEYPVLPYTSYQRMSANDIRDLLAYMKTLPPVPGKIRGHDLKFPFTLRRGVGLWRLAFLDGKPLPPEPQQSVAWIRGRYLVEGPAHCAECHSPRNFMGAIVSGKRFAGGLDPEGKSYIPNITPDDTGIGYWSKNEIASYLKTGVSPINIKAGDDMVAVIADTTTLSDDDRQAIGEYMKSLPAVDAPNAGMPEPNRTAVIRMLPKSDGKAAQSKLDALTSVGNQLASAATLYVVNTKPFSLQRATAGATGAQDGKVLGSTKLTVVARDGPMLQVRIDGWQQQGSDSAFYALQGQRILEAALSPAAVAKVVRGKPIHDTTTNLDWYQGSLTVWVQGGGMNTDLAQLWTYGHDLYGATCASCHSLQPTGNFLTNQWIGSLGAMKRYTSLDDDQYRLLLAYLQYHSKDVGAAPALAKTAAATP